MQGTKVGSYIIEEKIGEGGMGVVYAARHDRMHRPAVVKMLRKQLAQSPEMAKRFENEATAAASIGHPGIVQVFDIGKHTDGSLYIVMELLRGESLHARLARLGRLSVAQAISLVRQAAGALGAAHLAGIVHRDLKPDNMFIVPDPEVAGGERVKLLDFGIAKLSDEGAAGMTRTGAMMGTPHYMSPEQCQGAGGVDSRSDLYALGCILFQLVTGRTPFTGAGAGDFIVAHMTQQPPLLRSLAPDAPQALEGVVATLLAKKPEERFGSCEALANALGHIHVADVPLLGKKAIARTEVVAPHQVLGQAGSSVTNASLLPGPPATTMGLSAGQSSRAMSEQAGVSASLTMSPRARQQRTSAKWLLLAVFGALSVAAVSFAIVSRTPPSTPERTEVDSLAELSAPGVAAAQGAIGTEPEVAVPPPPPSAGNTLPGVEGLLATKEPAETKAKHPTRVQDRPAELKAKQVAPKKTLPPASKPSVSRPEPVAEVASPTRKVAVKAQADKGDVVAPAETQVVPSPAPDAARDRARIRKQMPHIKAQIQDCGRKHNVRKKQVQLTVSVGLDGRVNSAKLSPPGLGPLAACIKQTARQVQLAPLATPTTFTIPIFLQ